MHASMHSGMSEAVCRELVDRTSGTPGATRRSPNENPRRVHIYVRSQVATKKGVVEAIHKLAIVAPFVYLLPTH